MFRWLEAKELLDPGDATAATNDRSTPKREWFADAWLWLRSNESPDELEARFARLFPDDGCIEKMRDWAEHALELRPYVLKSIRR